METDNQDKVLQDFARSYVVYLKRKVPKNSGRLANSIKASVMKDNVGIDALGYITFLDQGVSGKNKRYRTPFGYTNKKPPISSISGFAQRAGINPFALQQSIFENGIKPEGFITNSIDKEVDKMADKLVDAVWEDFVVEENKKDKLKK